jgi:type IV secretory pathway TraG/TraD family ATPase VirD4
MTAAARPHGSYGESAHWTERAEALLAPVLHAAAVSGQGMRQVLGWVLLHDLHTPMALLAQGGDSTGVAIDVLAGIAATEDREKSGIFSTTAGALAAYRSARALALTDGADFDPGRFPFGGGTIYVCAPARYQALTAPVLVAFLEQLRAATYQAATAATLRLPVTLVLDEVANIAPLPDLPAMVSEGGGQGILTLACLQDLSQARARWGTAADGFFSLFGAKVVLPGIGDLRTLDTVSRLAGQGDAAVRSVNASAWWSGRPSASTTWSTRRQERLPVDQVHSLTPGTAIVVSQARPPQLAYLTPWWAYPPFLESRAAPPPALAPGPGPGPGPPRSPVPPPPPAPPGGVAGPAGDLPVTWRRVPGWRRPQAPPPHL